MTRKNNKFKIFLSSTAGLVMMAAMLVAVNMVGSQLRFRSDLTQDRLYTLSEGSKAIVSNLKSRVTIRFYCSRGKTEMPVHLKGFAKRIEDLLSEYEIAGNGKIVVEKYDPKPDSDAEDIASLDGVDGQLLSSGEKIYLGVAITCIDSTIAIPFLSPNNENSLEYDLTRLIYRVTHNDELSIGIMSSLPIMGGRGSPMAFPQTQQPSWVLVDELKKDHDIREIEMPTNEIPDDISVLIIIHPKDLSDTALFAVDQFILRGGNLIAFVDPLSVIDAQSSPQQPMMMGQQSNSSTLGKLFDAWGLQFETNKILVDMTYPTEIGGQGGQRQTSPAVLSLDDRAVNASDIVSGSLDNIIMAYAGVFSGEPIEGLKKTILIKSSNESQVIDSFRAQLPLDSIAKDFESADKAHEIAIRLVGQFKTAFPDGAPEEDDPEGEEDERESGSSNESGAEREFLVESKEKSAVILVGDVDMLSDDFWVRKANFFGQTILQVFGDNNNFLQNSVEQLSGDDSLISIRSRGVTNRPFLVVREMQLEAEKKYKEEISRLEDELSEAQQKINDLQQTKKDQDQRYILSTEQRNELEKMKEKRVQVNKKLKGLRKQLRKDIDSLENRLKFYNIGLMPIVVAFSGIGFAIFKRRKAGIK